MQTVDVLIIGGGIAGLYAALQFSSDVRVCLLTKGEAGISGSALAQGGIAAVLDHEEDSYEYHFADTMVAGRYKNNPAAVEQLIREGPAAVRDLIHLGAAFDTNDAGALQKTLEGGHSRRRIMHHRDQTGAEMVRALWARVRERSNVTILEHTACVDLALLPDGFLAMLDVWVGARHDVPCGYDVPLRTICAGFVILATGGIGQAYRYTTNPAISTGDGIHLAYALGAKVKNLHYVQFHPTAMPPLAGESSCFLVSEAVRGEGAFLRNRDGERFVSNYDTRGELAPRDVVSRAIIQESRRLKDTRFALDITQKSSDWLKARFPAIFAECQRRGIDMGRDCVPVFPCQHYLMGGLDVDLDGKTTVPRLYAAGECAHTGLHGANRLASNSLPEALVWGKRAAENIMRCLRAGFASSSGAQTLEARAPSEPPSTLQTQQLADYAAEIRTLLQESCFVFADKAALPNALLRVEEIRVALQSAQKTTETCEVQSMALCAKLIMEGLLNEPDDA
ncbi:MAG: L-aspartate oxidase [Oscillospiraceae bacterium]|jgi:L-aspartate oxidase|nr:L-aspartate oxidase [Oscillospiraceae bacterium]